MEHDVIKLLTCADEHRQEAHKSVRPQKIVAESLMSIAASLQALALMQAKK